MDFTRTIMATSKPMTKAEALKLFRFIYKIKAIENGYRRGDEVARRTEWNDYTDELKEKAKKLVGENAFVEYQSFIKMEHNEIRRLQKEFPDVYPLE